MKFAAVTVLMAGSAAAFTSSPSAKPSVALHETKADLEALAKDLNPVIKYWDPLQLADSALWGKSDEFTVGWLRHAEIKHSRVAMMAFVGYIAQSNHLHWPWSMTLGGEPFPSADLSPPEQWDALPIAARIQIILAVGFFEFYSELTPADNVSSGLAHYTKGGQPGKYPKFADGVPHWVPFELYDPFGLSGSMSDEKKERRLRMEINNGRLAMLGIIGFLSEQVTPGSVPVLKGLVPEYSGNVMAPFPEWA